MNKNYFLNSRGVLTWFLLNFVYFRVPCDVFYFSISQPKILMLNYLNYLFKCDVLLLSINLAIYIFNKLIIKL